MRRIQNSKYSMDGEEKQTCHEKLEKRGEEPTSKMEEGPAQTFFLGLVEGEKSFQFRTMSMTNMEATKNCFSPEHFQGSFFPTLFIFASQLPKSVFLKVTANQSYQKYQSTCLKFRFPSNTLHLPNLEVGRRITPFILHLRCAFQFKVTSQTKKSSQFAFGGGGAVV